MSQLDEREPSLGEMDDFNNAESPQKSRLVGYVVAGVTFLVLILMTLLITLR